MAESELAPKFAPFFSFAGIAAAMIFGSAGAAYGTAKSGIGIAGVGTFRSDLIMKSLIPVVMSGIIAVYGLVVAVLIAQAVGPTTNMSLYTGFMHLGAGLSVGLTGVAAGYTIGVVGDAGVRAYMQQSRVYVGMILILIFGEVLGLYGTTATTSTIRLQHSPNEAPGTMVFPRPNGSLHQIEKSIVESLRSSPRSSNPFLITERQGEKQLCIQSRTLRVTDFVLIKTLGTGTFARVWLTRLKDQKDKSKVYALKILRKADVIKLKQVEHVRNERKALAAVIDHPFITTLIASFSDEKSLYMLLDYCPGGEIFTYLRKQRRFSEETSIFYAAEITMTIEFLHDVHGIAYRDLKPENILLDADGHLKLVDFGFAKQVDNRETYTLCGTPEYLAPEVIQNSGHGLAVDWWALGILIYEFLIGQPPFWDQNPMRIYEQIVEGRLRFPPNMPPAAQNIVSLLCKTNPTERLGHISGGSTRVKSHPFFQNVIWDDLFYRRVKGPILPRLSHPADTGNFEEYPDPPDVRHANIYTDDLKKKYEALFSDF
ncbi:unnamed protein product [Penicillium salamii]|uniref:V-type proton ATPase subunit C n=1 Tax=Penicillium salamii TaxID=1612424 RepID=A0A9W4JZY8_9EURO|nr:unnamed protein product [Penicillium salamii]CAG8336874.1 unnamed protein product [Penicillium salamii]CAG8337942.1 unnamed protein product [Penicillium salamii]CAG8370880.1 unnamed protein product [Penicillium salamii]CAG8387186.1 unnamed protein product [Penicillium salamii]